MSKSKTMPETQIIWVAMNKNGSVRMFLDEPIRNRTTGRWESKRPFVNSKLYEDIIKIIEHSSVTWESEPNFFEIQINV